MVAEQLRQVANGDEARWPAAQALIHPELVRLARRQPIGRLRDDHDSAHEVAARVLERMHANDFRALKRLFESETVPVVQAWIRVLVRSAAIDVMRQHTEYQRASPTRASGWISLVSLASSPGSPAPASLVDKQRDLERFLARAQEEAAAVAGTDDAANVLARRWEIEPVQARRLLQKGERYVPILRLVLAGHSYPEVAEQLSLTRREIELTVQYIEEFLEARGFARPVPRS